MSFTNNPFYTLTLAESPTTTKIHWICESCGAQSKTAFDVSSPLVEIWNDFIDHIRNSHRRRKLDFESWGTLVR